MSTDTISPLHRRGRIHRRPRRPELTTTTAPIGFDCQSFLTTAVVQFSDV